MSFSLPTLRVGDPVCHNALSVFPLFADGMGEVEYRLADAALADQTVLVEEINHGGSVPDLLVENKGDVRVLFLEGEELVGAKQNRVLNTSVLVAAHSKIKIPVSCVEQGRWGYKSQYFGSSGSHSPSKLRRALKSSVTRSVKAKQGHSSHQGAVWNEVASLHKTHAVQSDTAAMSDAFDSHQESIAAYREHVNYIPEALGLVVAVGERIVSMDLFDKPATCEKVWHRLLSGVVFDALEAAGTASRPQVADVERILAKARELPWEAAQAVGEGEEYRAESAQGDHASALSFEDTIVHGSVMAAV